MDEVKVAIPYEMARTIKIYCAMQGSCTFCIFKKAGDCWHIGCPSGWDLDMMRMEGKDNG